MSEHFEAERDSALRSIILREISSNYEIHILDERWDEFVEFINKIDSERKERIKKII